MGDEGEFRIEFQPLGRRGACTAGITVLEAARLLGVDLAGLCGGAGVCGACKIRFVEGVAPAAVPADEREFGAEELAEGWRLACRAVPTGDCKIYAPPESLGAAQRLQIETEEVALELDSHAGLGLAIDLGSTKIAAYLVEAASGKTLAAGAVMNPQIAYGEDVIARMDAALKSESQARLLRDLVRTSLAGLTERLCKEAGTASSEIREAVIVGNTVMHHLLLDLPVGGLARSPFVPAASGPTEVNARDLGLPLAPEACVYLPPLIAAFVGCDHTAVLSAITAGKKRDTALVVDIGTNTELSLVTPDGIACASCASGPTFEGYHITHGMRAAPGAIERLRIEEAEVFLQTIDDAEPIGICGSGIIDAVAELLRERILDRSGRFVPGSHPNVSGERGRAEFILVPAERVRGGRAISVTQADVREVQAGKAAIQAAVTILLDRFGLRPDDLDRVIVAGAFGTYLDIKKSMELGMLPLLPLGKYRQVGNAAGAGARALLLSAKERRRMEDLITRVRYVELAGNPDFGGAFIRACAFGAYN